MVMSLSRRWNHTGVRSGIRQPEVHDEVAVETEFVDFDIEQVVLRIDPGEPFSDLG